jgi:hypothetical protein
VAASNRAVAYAGCTSRLARAGFLACAHRIGWVARGRPPGRSSVAAPGPQCQEVRASDSAYPPALRSAPLKPLARHVWYPRRSVTFGIAGPCWAGRAGWNRAGRDGLNPVGADVAEAPAAVMHNTGKRYITGHLELPTDGRSHVMDYRTVRAFPTPVTSC